MSVTIGSGSWQGASSAERSARPAEPRLRSASGARSSLKFSDGDPMAARPYGGPLRTSPCHPLPIGALVKNVDQFYFP